MRTVAVYRPPRSKPAVERYLTAFAEGAARRLDLDAWRVELRAGDDPDPNADLTVVWGARAQPIRTAKAARRPYLVLERGYFGNRADYTSLTYNGLNGWGWRPEPGEGERPEPECRPWREPGGEYVLLCGQVDGDVALTELSNPQRWYEGAIEALRARFQVPVHFREHPRWPWSPPRNADERHRGNPRAEGGKALEEALAGAICAVTWSSTVGVEIVQAGVPLIACDRGSPAYEVAAHGLAEELVRPDRALWQRRLAWAQWNLAELASGEAAGYIFGGYDAARARAERGEYGAWPRMDPATG